MANNRKYSAIVRTLKVLSLGMSRTRVVGLSNFPRNGGVIIAPNHVSNIDPVLLGVQLARVRPVQALAKDGLFKVPVIGAAMRAMGHIPVVRGSAQASESLGIAEGLLAQGSAVAVYPEGTIPKEPKGLLGVFKSGASRLAFTSECPVVPVGQWGAQQVLPRGGNTIKSLLKAFFKRPINVIVIGEPILPPALGLVDDENTGELIRQYTQDLRERVLALTIQARQIIDPTFIPEEIDLGTPTAATAIIALPDSPVADKTSTNDTETSLVTKKPVVVAVDAVEEGLVPAVNGVTEEEVIPLDLGEVSLCGGVVLLDDDGEPTVIVTNEN